MLSFEEYVSRRRAGESKESLQDSMRKKSGEESVSASFSSGGSMSAGFENYVRLRKAGYSSEEIFGGGDEALQRQKKLEAAHERALETSRAAMAAAKQQKLDALGFDNEEDYLKAWDLFAQGKAESLGEAHYELRKQTEEEAKDDYWRAFRQLFGNAAQSAQEGMWGVQARPEDQLARAEESAAAAAQMREAKVRQKNAARAIEWDGRQELIDELKALDDSAAGWVTNEQQEAEYEDRRREILDKLEAGDIAVGNGTRSYTGRDSVGHFITGTGENIGSGIIAAGGALGRAAAQNEVLREATNQDQFILDALRGRGEENLQRQQAARELVQSEEFNAPFERVLDVAQGISDDAARELQTLKEGKSALGQAGIDIAENVVEMGFDAGVGALTGGGSLASMFVRVMGSGVLEARQDGADPTQQLLYGAAKGGIEVLTEKLVDGVAGIYGKGAADEITQDLIRRLTENRTGRALLLALSGAIEEGGEEVLSDLLSPLAEKIYKDESLGELYGQIDPSEVLYDFLIGAAIGGLGSVTSLANGQTQEDLFEMDLADATEYESTDYQAKSAMDVLNGRVSFEEQQARDAEAQARSERAWERLGLGENQAPSYLYQEHHGNILDGIRNHISDVDDMESVSTITGNEFQKSADDSRSLREKVIEFFNSLGNKVTRSGFGDIALNNAGVHDSLGHGYGKLKAATFASLPDVLKNGKVISYDPNYQNRGYESYLIVAPVNVGEERVYVGAYVIKDINTQRYKVHEVLTTKKDGSQSFKTEASKLESGSATVNPSKNNIPRGPVYVKESLTPEVSTAKGAGKIVNVNPANGKVAVQLADGSSAVMTADEAGFSGAARTLFDAVRELGESSAEAYAAYPSDGSMDIDSYVAAWKAAEELGEMGLKPESVDKLRLTNVLEEDTRRLAYRKGQEKREAQASARADEGIGPYEGDRAQPSRGSVSFAGGTVDGVSYQGVSEEKARSLAYRMGQEKREAQASARADEGIGPYEGDRAQPSRGSVSFEGGTVGGVSYQGVSESKASNLNKRQEAAVSAAYALAEVTGFDFVFYEGESSKGAQGIYQQGGKIWLNINAGRHLGQDLIGFTMSHELTHAIQEWAPEQYDALRQFVVEKVLQEDDLDALVTARRKAEPNLSFTEAVDEIVADGCEMMLKDSKAIRELAESNKTLAEKIADFLRDFVKSLREAFGDTLARHPEAQLLMQHAEEQQKLWDEGLKAAVENRRAGTKNTAYKEGGMRYSYGGELADNADFAALDAAQKMEQEGTDAETIRRDTGWFRGMDSKWRFEIDDSTMQYKRWGDAQFRQDHPEYVEYQNLMDKVLTGWLTEEESARLQELDSMWGNEMGRLNKLVDHGSATLEMVLNHPALFKAYPKLRKTRVEFKDLGHGERGYYDRRRNAIVLSSELRRDPGNHLIHEIQHAIQSIEGFTSGSSPMAWEIRGWEALEEARGYEQAVARELDRFVDADDYLQELDQQYERGDLSEDEYYRQSEEYLRGSREYQKLQRDYMLAGRRRRAFERNRTAKDLYRNTAGEIEARDVQSRMNYDGELRRGIAPNLGDENTVFADGTEWSLQAVGLTNTNTPFVEITDDILAGVPQADWRKTVKDNLKSKFPNGIALGRNNVVIDGQSRKEMTYSRYTKWLAANDPQMFADKMRATNNADEILQAARDWINEGPLHPRTDKITDFARGKVLLRIGTNDYIADVVVATENDGTMKLYDMIDLAPTQFIAKETDTAIARNPSPGGRRNTVTVSDNSITQESEFGNTNFSVSDSVSDRSLLLEAAEREGASASEDLRRFANRVKDLEGLQRRLERQEKKLEGLREENDRADEGIGPYSKEIAALEERIAETRELIERTERRIDQLEKGAKLQREAKKLRERWFEQNAAEAVELQTKIQQENRRAGYKNTAYKEGSVRYSIAPAFTQEIDKWDGKSDKTFRLGSTSEALQSIGVKDTGIIWHGQKIGKILKKHPAMTKEIIKQVPSVLENPVMVLQSQNSDSRIVMLGEVYDSAGDIVTAVLELQPTTKGGQIQDMSVVVSAYGKNFSPQQFVNDSGLLYVDPDRERTKRWMQGLGLSLPSDTTALGSIGNITYHDGEVKIESVPYAEYMQTVRKDVTYEGKVPATKTTGQIAFEEALRKKNQNSTTEKESANAKYQMEDSPRNDRALLAAALESAAYTDAERDMLRNYQDRIAKVDAIEADYKEAVAAYEAAREENRWSDRTRELKEKADKLGDKLSKADRELMKLNAMRPLQEMMLREKKKARRKSAENERRKATEKEEEATLRRKIDRNVKRLSSYMLTNSKSKHIPEPLKPVIGDFLTAIDMAGRPGYYEGKFSKRDVEFATALQNVAKMLREQVERQYDLDTSEEYAEAIGGFIDLPDGFLAEFDKILTEVKQFEKERETKWTMATAKLPTLRQLDKILTALSTAVTQSNDLFTTQRFKHADKAGQKTLAEMRELGTVKRIKGVSDFLEYENMNPIYAFDSFGEVGKELFTAISEAQEKYARNVQQIVRFKETVLKDVPLADWAKEMHSFKLSNGKTLQMTAMQMIDFYDTWMRSGGTGKNHQLGGGIQLKSEGQGIKGIIADTAEAEQSMLMLSDVQQIIREMSREQIRVADLMAEFVTKQGGEWGNEITMQRWGFRQYEEDRYWPVQTVATGHDAKSTERESGQGDLNRIQNFGFTKALTPNAKNAIVIEDALTKMVNHMTDMAKHNAYAMVLTDIMKWYNYRETEILQVEDSDYDDPMSQVTYKKPKTSSVQQEIELARGKGARRFFVNFLTDLNGSFDGGRDSGLVSTMISNYKAAQIGFNLRVVIQQPTSYLRAGLVIKPQYLMQARSTKQSREEMKRSGLALWKTELDMYDMSAARSIRERLADAGGWKGRVRDAAGWLAGKADEFTWGAIWSAAKLQVQDQKGLTGEELLEETRKLFNETVLRTQVMDSVITRSELMRSRSGLIKEMTAFMSEPTMQYSIAASQLMRIQDEARRSGDWKEAARTQLGKTGYTMTVLVLGILTNVLATGFYDIGRDDDEYENFVEKWCEHFKKNLGNEINPLTWIPLVKDLWEASSNLLQGKEWNADMMYASGLSRTVTATLATMEWIQRKQNPKQKATSLTWYGNMTDWGLIYKDLQAVSTVFGLPISGMTRSATDAYNLVASLWNTVSGDRNGRHINYASTYDAGPKNEIKYAYQDGYLTEEEAVQYLIEEGVAKNRPEAEKLLAPYRWQSEYKKQIMRRELGELTESAANGWYVYAESVGISAETYYSFSADTKDLHSDKDAEGKDIKGQTKKDKTLAFIHSMPLSTAQKDALYFAAGYKESGLKDAPWHTAD